MKLTWQQKIWIYGGTLLHALKPVMVYMTVPPLLLAVSSLLFNRQKYRASPEYCEYATNFYTFLGLLLVFLILIRSAKKRGVSLKDEVTLSFRGLQWNYLFGMGAFGAAAAVGISAVYTFLPEALMQSYNEMSYSSFEAYDVTLAVVSTAVVAPVLEEMVFRGYMLNRLLSVFEENKSVAIVSIFFALCHVNVFWGLYGLFMGYLLARVSIRQDNIIYSMAMHIGFNLPAVCNYVIQNSAALRRVFYGSRFLIVGYGVLSCCVAVLLWRQYKKYENL